MKNLIPLAELRRAAGLSQRQLGIRLGLGQAAVGRRERIPADVRPLRDYLAVLGYELQLFAVRHGDPETGAARKTARIG